jgi:hypothetical protein
VGREPGPAAQQPAPALLRADRHGPGVTKRTPQARNHPEVDPETTSRRRLGKRGRRLLVRRPAEAWIRPQPARRPRPASCSPTLPNVGCPFPRRAQGSAKCSRASARHTNAAVTNACRWHWLALPPATSRSETHSAALAGDREQTRGCVCTAEVRGSTPLRSTTDLQGSCALHALRETPEMAVCNHPATQIRASCWALLGSSDTRWDGGGRLWPTDALG